MKNQRLLWTALLALPLTLRETGCRARLRRLGARHGGGQETEPFGGYGGRARGQDGRGPGRPGRAGHLRQRRARALYESHIAAAKWVRFSDVTAGDFPAEKDATLVFYCANEH